MKKRVIIAGLTVLILGGTYWVASTNYVRAPGAEDQACTTDAKVCPDGSAVGRTGPNCEFAECPQSESESNGSDGGIKSVAIGESVTTQGVTIRVLELLEDSRCAADVQCIWAGTVRVRSLVDFDTVSREFTFTLGEEQLTSIGGFGITLSSVEPGEKISTRTVSASEYLFTFTVVP